MRRFRTTTFFVEGRDRPERRRRVYGAPRLVALAVGLPVLVLWFVLANTGLAVMPILQGLVVWLAVSRSFRVHWNRSLRWPLRFAPRPDPGT